MDYIFIIFSNILKKLSQMVGSLNPMFVSDIKGIILKVSLLFVEVTHDSHKMLTIILPHFLIFFNIIYYKRITHCYVKITIESIFFSFAIICTISFLSLLWSTDFIFSIYLSFKILRSITISGTSIILLKMFSFKGKIKLYFYFTHGMINLFIQRALLHWYIHKACYSDLYFFLSKNQ